MRYHFIAIGGSVMHNLAIALHHTGHEISGSDDEIYEPARSALDAVGLLPGKIGWDPARVTMDIDAVVLGMHARDDNPELGAARKLGIPIYSFPEFIAAKSREKTRVAVAGSHGKTTTTSMLMHVLKDQGTDFDYLVGARIEGFETMVRISEADTVVLEADEYLSSALDRRPKFLHYKPQIAIITGIAWDHMNVFPTFENYCNQFRKFLESMPPSSRLFYFEGDATLGQLVSEHGSHLVATAYTGLQPMTGEGDTVVVLEGSRYRLPFFGQHNMENLAAAIHVLGVLGIPASKSLESLTRFTGAARRLETIVETGDSLAIRDFAHAPSKVRATLRAVRGRYPEKRLVACFELHTYSSLNEAFLPEYMGTMDDADVPIVLYDPKTLDIKKLPSLSPAKIRAAFGDPDLQVLEEARGLAERLNAIPGGNTVLLWMSSGHFGGLDIKALSERVFSAG